MIMFEQAERILKKVPVKLCTEEIRLDSALHRILAKDIVSQIDMPPFDKSAMDGYALQSSDTSDKFQILETIPAGVVPSKTIHKGHCAKIMTGGKIPQGADRVVKREITVEEEGYMKIIGRDENVNICKKGEDVKTSGVVLNKGTILRAAEIGIAASTGVSLIKVYRRPEIGILTTGSELVPPGCPLEEGQIYDSNSFSLAAQVILTGAVVKQISSTSDIRENIRKSIQKMLGTCDVMFISGGVSMGDFDYVPGILKELGVSLHFEKVAVRPGMPTVFGTKEDKFVFGIPGNPVSTFVIFEIFIKPLLFRMMGFDFQPEKIKGILKTKFKRRTTEREAFVPVRLRDGEVELLPYHGSAHIHSLYRANGLMRVTRGVEEILEGSTVHVRLI
ncbi:MAG: molybdopterin molybdotransferase MoeA [Candidatus Aminicenantes bacterium]|jgi:molybdopterin molybdotransferase